MECSFAVVEIISKHIREHQRERLSEMAPGVQEVEAFAGG
jgi:hypothetical protein